MRGFFSLAYVFLAFCCPSYAWNIDYHLTGLVAQHLRAPADQLLDSSNSLQDFSIRTELHGKGFHRTLQLQIDHVSAVYSLQKCQPIVIQPLPSSIYADPYQLGDLTRSAGGSSMEIEAAGGDNNGRADSAVDLSSAYTFKLLGPLDLELPAPACHSNLLLLEFNLTQQAQQQQQGLGALLSVPLHAKYPQPRAFGFTGWQALSSGHVHFLVPKPWLLLDCRATGGKLHTMRSSDVPQQQRQQQMEDSARDLSSVGGARAQLQQDVLVWSIPAGNLDHLQLVSWGTLVVSAACSAMLSVRALQQR